MTTMDVVVDDQIMDFSTPLRTIKFRIDDDVFEALPEIAAITMMRFADDASRLDRDDVDALEQVKIMQNLFRMVLVPESATRFIGRLEDNVRPISMNKFVEITRWLLEQYGLRPTEPDSAS